MPPLLPPPAGSSRGFDLVSPFSVELLFIGIALFAAIGALSHEEERPFSAGLVYVMLGLLAAAGVSLLDVRWIEPLRDASLLDHLTEIALIVALFAGGLRVRRRPSLSGWAGPLLLIGVAMPLTIAAVAAFGALAMGLSLGAAILLGSILAPTDPVLAGGVGLPPPGEEVESDARFNLTAEASMNDALVAPFVLLGLFVAGEAGGWGLEWVLADLLYATVVPAAGGWGAGWALGRLTAWARRRELLSPELDGFAVIGIVLLVYGFFDTIDTYGFLAVFAAGIGFRSYEAEHEYNRRAHDGAVIAQNFLELGVLLLLGSLVTLDGLGTPELAGWLLVPLLILVIRPLIAAAVLAPRGIPPGERAFVGLFGVKGVASIHYAAIALEADVIAQGEALVLFWTATVAVLVSVVVHGASADALGRRLLGR